MRDSTLHIFLYSLLSWCLLLCSHRLQTDVFISTASLFFTMMILLSVSLDDDMMLTVSCVWCDDDAAGLWSFNKSSRTRRRRKKHYLVLHTSTYHHRGCISTRHHHINANKKRTQYTDKHYIHPTRENTEDRQQKNLMNILSVEYKKMLIIVRL